MFEEAIRDVIGVAGVVADDDSAGTRSDTAQAAADGPDPLPVTRGSGFRKGRGVKQSRGG
jgi:hypothetical protein